MGPSDGKSLSDRLRSTSRQHPLQRLPDRQFHLSYPGFHHRRKAETSLRLLKEFLETLPLYPGETEPRYNLFAWTDRQGNYVAAYFPRTAHRPSCYTAEGDECIMVSPGALDMSGLLVVPRKEDYDKISENQLLQIYNEVSL